MAFIDININEDDYYKIYTGHTRALIILKQSLVNNSLKDLDEAVIHCVYNNGKVDRWRHISPIYRTIMYIQNSIPGLEDKFSLVHLK